MPGSRRPVRVNGERRDAGSRLELDLADTTLSALLLWLVGLALPLLPFGYGHSLALTGILLPPALPAARK